MILQQRGLLGLAVDEVDCDYYDYLNGKVSLEKDITYRVVINTTADAGEYSLELKFVKYSGPVIGELPDDEF